jgi:hypothetical protein
MGGHMLASWSVRSAFFFKSPILEALELVETKVTIERTKRASIAFPTGAMHPFSTFAPYI